MWYVSCVALADAVCVCCIALADAVCVCCVALADAVCVCRVALADAVYVGRVALADAGASRYGHEHVLASPSPPAYSSLHKLVQIARKFVTVNRVEYGDMKSMCAWGHAWSVRVRVMCAALNVGTCRHMSHLNPYKPCAHKRTCQHLSLQVISLQSNKLALALPCSYPCPCPRPCSCPSLLLLLLFPCPSFPLPLP